MTTTNNQELTETSVQPPVGIPGRIAPILFGFLGAWWASTKAKKLGVTNTKRYWIIGAISTGVSMLLGLLIPVALVLMLSASIGSTGTFNNPSAVSPLGSSVEAPVASAPAAGGPIQPVASSPKELIERIEAYRFQALFTGDLSRLDNYYPSREDMGWKHDFEVINEGKIIGNIYNTITDIELVSVTETEIVANVSLSTKTTFDGQTVNYKDGYPYPNTYRLINGRWYFILVK